MKANVGDRLVTEGPDGQRECLIIGLQHADGSPPYVVRWLADGHIALVYRGLSPGWCTPRTGPGGPTRCRDSQAGGPGGTSPGPAVLPRGWLLIPGAVDEVMAAG